MNMKSAIPAFTIREEHGRFWIDFKIHIMVYQRASYCSYILAECMGKNFQDMFTQGWRAREKALRETLGIED